MASSSFLLRTGPRFAYPGAQLPTNRSMLAASPSPAAVNPGNLTQMPGPVLQDPPGWTKDDKDQFDETARKQAMGDLIQSWNDRLSLISVITTFFAGTEASIVTATIPSDKFAASKVFQAANCGLCASLIVHSFAAIVSFLAAFFLIRYKLLEATEEERKVEGGSAESSLYSSRIPRLEQVGPFGSGQPPVHLIRRCHYLCVWLTAIGFFLAMGGIVCFIWALMPPFVAWFSTGCVGVCIVGGFLAVL